MLPSRGLARNPASALRYSLSTSSRTKPTRTLSTRQFSQAQPHSPVLPRYGLSRTTACHSGRVMPSVSPVGYGAPAAMAAGVFAQRSGAARNLSLWPFQSKSQNTQTAETLADPLPEPPVAAQSPVAEAPTVSVSSAPAEPASNAADLSQLPEDLLREFDSQSLLDIPERIGYLKELGLDYAIGPTASCQWLVEHIHVYSGMPWWGTLASAAILFRVAMFYPTLDGAKHQARLQKVQSDPAYVKAKAEFEEAAFRTKDRASMMYARSDMRRLVKESGVSMWKPFIGFATVPFSFGMFRLIRAMTNVPVPGMETGGLAWFTDLTVADPFYILPMVSVGLGSLMVIVCSSNPSPVYI
ncbi:60Kd inner membrane protein-domain-containing protein [Xylaria sp. FL1777]|nr:60Kd inner membrane protein-domain-containing protein [Xylaria sp. FL1777]